MDRREIQSRGGAITKALQGNEPASDLLSLLQDLKKHVKPTEELLRATQIGRTVNKCKAHKNPEVAKLASEIVSRWRHVVNEQKNANGGSTPQGGRINGTASPAPVQQPPTPKSPAVDLEKRTWKTDKVSRDNLTSDTGRNNCIGLMYDGLAPGSSLPTSHILDIAKQIESATLNLPAAKGSPLSSVYKEKIRSLYQNLKHKSNPYLRQKLLSGKVTPEKFVVMTHEELKSREQREEEKKIEKINMDKAMVAQEEKSVSTALECGKCHKKRVSYTQAQTRSADEPMTTFCECLECGNRWKFS